MEELPVELCLKIFCFLDYQNLSVAQQVCRKWNVLGSDNDLWANLFKERWGETRSEFHTPVESKTWKEVFEVQDRCDRVGLGLKIIREGVDCYLVYQGEVKRHLCSRRQRKQQNEHNQEGSRVGRPSYGILEKILFFIGDLEVASNEAKRSRLM
ncbi:uncharacterized protein LOC130802305 [Amaranthus tricolor]|uniref:uncharacterized protein LOC130802305 n=1 Tax=Amaranthus tricolor TaxID=29722 RepID=UPI00258EC309|nr:uncharacterized protein LOC130802305 [Amaranthus tricolor]